MDSLCISQDNSLINTSLNASDYVWDFCFDALENETSSSPVTVIPESINPEGINIVKDNANWYGFVSSRDNDKLFRLDFGSSIKNSPAIIDLGNPAGLVRGPKEIKFIKEGDNWYGVLLNYGTSNLVLLSFGNYLNNTPTASNIGNLSNWNTLRGADLVQTNDSLVLIVSSSNNNKLTLINFGSSITNMPTSDGILDIGISNQLINRPMGVSLKKVENKWYGLVSSYNANKIVMMKFGSKLFSSPDFIDAGTLSLPTDCVLQKDGDKYYGLVQTRNSGIFRLNFGNNPEQIPTPQAMTNASGLSNIFNISLLRTPPTWSLFTIGASDKTVKRIDFEDICGFVNNNTSTEFKPQNISYPTAGTYAIELTAFDSLGNFDTHMETIVVRDATAPTTSFVTENACIDNENVFNASSSDDAGITSWSWDFGDGTAPTSGQNVSHQFLGTGNYEVKLSIEAVNGCSNTAGKTISIYNPPVSDFTYTSGITCSNSPLSFSNNTVFSGPDSVLTYSWNMDGEAILYTKNPAYTFASGGDKTITLSTAIPGCTNTQSQIVSITPGPLTSFSFAGSCAYDNYQFTNATSGENITGFYWNFGDGYTSSVESPSHNFASAGNYVVSLTASNASGCNTAAQQVVPVNYIPQLNFTNDLACSENPVTFYDQSSVINANITEQYWTLSNNLIGYKSEGFGPTPTFRPGEAGEYTMTLIGISNYGCADTLVRQGVNVKHSPIADFSHENHCFGDTTILSQIVELPEGVNLLTVDWLIDGVLLSGNELKYKFPGTGSKEVEMFVRADNLCTGNVSKTVDIIPLPAIDIQLSSHCEDQPALVSALTNPGNDPVRSYSWSIDGKPVSSQQYFSYTFKNPADYAISLLVATANNCVNALEEIFTINPSPVSEFEVFPSIGASPLVVQFTNRSKGATSVLYDFSKLNDDQNSSFNPVYTYTTLGKDMPIQIASNAFGCTDTSFVQIEVVIPVYDLAITSAVAEEVSGKLKLFVELMNKGTIIVNNPQIRIDIDERSSLNQKLEGRLMPDDIQKFELDFEVFIHNEHLNYICFSTENTLGTYTDSNPYNNTQCLSLENSFTVMDPFPNPSSTFVELPIILPSSGKCDIRMVGQRGDLIFAREFKNLPPGLNVVKVDLNTYNQGMYLFNIKFGNYEVTKKVVIR